MRIIHFADNHLGAGIDQREQDILNSFQEAIDKIIDLRPDLVINAGDLFHMVRPSNRVIAFASEQLLRLGREAKIPTIIISGNHDAVKQRPIGDVLSIFRGFENIYPVYDSRLQRLRFGEISVSALPHCITVEQMKAQIDLLSPDHEAKLNILVMHGAVSGIDAFKMADLAEQEIPQACFQKGYDYVALGHYHNFTRVQTNGAASIVYYSGSTERLSQAEAKSEKGLIEVDFTRRTETEMIKFHPVTTRAMLELPAVNAKGKSAQKILAEIEAAVAAQNPGEKIIRIDVAGIPEETYRALSFDKIADLKQKAFSLDIRFEKTEDSQTNRAFDLNLGRLDHAFETFLADQKIEGLDKARIKELSLQYLHRAESDET